MDTNYGETKTISFYTYDDTHGLLSNKIEQTTTIKILENVKLLQISSNSTITCLTTYQIHRH